MVRLAGWHGSAVEIISDGMGLAVMWGIVSFVAFFTGVAFVSLISFVAFLSFDGCKPFLIGESTAVSPVEVIDFPNFGIVLVSENA